MALGSGLGKSVGIALETTWAVPKAPTVHVPLVDETIKRKKGRVESKGVIAGARTMRSSQWSPGNQSFAGGLQLEVTTLDMLLWLQLMMGAVSINPLGGGRYDHVFTMGDLADDSATIQLGKPDVNDVTQPFTYPGGMVDSWEIALAAEEIATLGIDWVARDEILVRTVADGVTVNADATVTSATAAFRRDDVGKPISGAGIPANSYVGVLNSATSIELSSSPFEHVSVNATGAGTGVTLTIGMALTTPSYSAGIEPMTFLGGDVLIAGVSTDVKNITIACDNGIAKNRNFVGSDKIKKPKENALRKPNGKISLEFENLLHYRRFCDDAELAMVLRLASDDGQELEFTTNIRYDGDNPEIKGTDLGQIEIPYVCLGVDDDASALTAVFNTTEATP